jgi:GNAT superfamily N-acetyltransferase
MTDIRQATVDDAAALAELRWEFRAGRREPVESHGAFVSRCTAWMQNELRGSQWRAWVAVRDGRIVGHLWLATISKIPNPSPERERHAYVSNVYVQPSARGGIGSRLLDAALTQAKAEATDRVILWATPLSKPLYARHGFTRDGEVMELKIE